MSDDTGSTPTYIARCPECRGIVACAAAPVDEPRVMRDAITHRLRWERAGFVLSTGTANDIRTAPDFGHQGECPRAKRKRRGRAKS